MSRAAHILAFCSIGLTLSAAVSCSSQPRYAQTARDPAEDDGGGAASGNCAGSLAERLTVTQLDLAVAVRYKYAGYDMFPRDSRIALSSDGAGAARVAWVDSAGTSVHVTPLDAHLRRSAADDTFDGKDIGGLVARSDGFLLLTRGRDPGMPLSDPAASGALADAAILIRQRDGATAFNVALTGTASITGPGDHDCAPLMYGRLAWNGTKYGAYFVVHGCSGDDHAPYYGDKLVYLDDRGHALSGGWSWNCSINAGLQLLPESDVFTSLCLADSSPFQGLNIVVPKATRQLAAEHATDGWVGGQFGSVIKLGGDYVIAWLSRGVDASGHDAAKRAPDIALLRLGPDYASLEPQRWLRETPNIAEANLHLAAYGSDRMLLVWDEIDQLDCRNGYTCFGRYTGTHAQLLDAHGDALGKDSVITAVPNSDDDIAVLANGDLAWAFVREDGRSYAALNNVAQLPTKRAIQLARFAYCP